MASNLTRQEIHMFEQGWVSAPMAAARLGVHVATIHRLCHSGKIRERDTQKVGRTRFIRIEALAAAHEPSVRALFGLNSWSDVAEKVRQASSQHR